MPTTDSPNWHNTLNVHTRLGWMGVQQQHALDLGYPFFAWNDRVYHTRGGDDTGYIVVQGNITLRDS